MALPNLKTKVKQNLKKDIENDKKSNNKNDGRILNYFDLKEGEKMTILFVPDVNGEFWSRFSKHGPQVKIKNAKGQATSVRGIGSINCSYKSSGEDCPACIKGFDLFAEAKETNSKELKEEGKKWMPRDYTLVSCIVLESPVDIATDETKNEVKLFYLPYAIEETIKESIEEGIIDEDALCTTPFIIKKTEGKGGNASYANSYFGRKQVTDEDLEFLEDLVVEQYDYSNLDLIPPPSTSEDVQEWLDKAEETYAKALAKSSSGKGGDSDGGTRVSKSAVGDRLKRRQNEEEEEEEQTTSDASQEAEAEEDDSSSDQADSASDDGGDEGGEESGGSDINSRLERLRKRNR